MRGIITKTAFIMAFLIALLSAGLTGSLISAAELANLSGYGFATCDSYEGENTVALTAVDGDVLNSSRWISAVSVKLDAEKGIYRNMQGKTSWLQVEFEIPTEIQSAKIYWAIEKAAEGYYKLQYSDDGENWTEVNNFSSKRNDGNGSVLNPCIDTITFDTVKAKYYRVEISAGMYQDGLGSIYEFELYGDPSQYDYVRKNTATPAASSESVSMRGGVPVELVIITGCVLAAIIITAALIVLMKRKGAGNK